ncbi:hypothetical protein PYW08_000347 [Mythimna loreyi]|uniref:Uncharacterized protein n=1 Tax=Mythimna loreyi TaxID=667449 RepID=A0ACC2RC75_9NEOP|nr:hypothetical protein PYW08_000347 [Mythimna loreyi]
MSANRKGQGHGGKSEKESLVLDRQGKLLDHWQILVLSYVFFKSTNIPKGVDPTPSTVRRRLPCNGTAPPPADGAAPCRATASCTDVLTIVEAYSVACLGVTSLDWERLGVAAIEELAFEIARKAFQRSENIVFLNLIDHLQERFEAGEKRAVVLGEVLAYRGRYADAARSYHSVGRDERALNLYVDLRMFNKAQEYVGEGEGLAALARRRAEWARHVNEPRAAAEMYLAAGDVKRAAELMAETGRRDMLIELARKLDKGSSGSLHYVAEALVKAGEPATAADVYQRLGDYTKVAQLAVAAGEWSRAFALAREHAECKREVYLPYAHRMAQENKFVDAQKAYHMAGETTTAMRVFTILVGNAVAEERFSDAGYLHHLLATQCLETAAAATTDKERNSSLRAFVYNDRLARIYHAYDVVHRCVHEPFSLSQPEALLNAARYILALIDAEPPTGVSMFCLYLCLSKQAKALNANTLARQMLDKILGLQIPHKFQTEETSEYHHYDDERGDE